MYCQYKIGATMQLLWTLQWRKTLWVWGRENTEVHGDHWWRNASCALNLISKFVLLSLGRYLCLWTICPRVYHPHCSQCLFNLPLLWSRSIYYIFWKSRGAIPIIHSWWFKDGINLPCMQGSNERIIMLPGNKSTWYIHHLVLSQCMACHRIFNKSNMTGATGRAGIITPFGETVLISGFCEARVVHVVQLHVFTSFYSVLWCPLSF